MNDTIPTVKIISTDTVLGYIIINEADFDADTMALYEPTDVPPVKRVKPVSA